VESCGTAKIYKLRRSLFCFRYLASVELHTRLAHAEVEVLCPHVVLDDPVVEQLADVVLEVRSNQPERVL
jgi:hypothetical protein